MTHKTSSSDAINVFYSRTLSTWDSSALSIVSLLIIPSSIHKFRPGLGKGVKKYSGTFCRILLWSQVFSSLSTYYSLPWSVTHHPALQFAYFFFKDLFFQGMNYPSRPTSNNHSSSSSSTSFQFLAGPSTSSSNMPTRTSPRIKSYSTSSSTGKKMYEEEISSEGSNFDIGSSSRKSSSTVPSFVDKNSQEYKEKRERNNNAVKASRERFAKKFEKVTKDVQVLEREKKDLKVKVRDVKTSYNTLKDLYETSFGPMDEYMEKSLFQ